MSEPTEKEYARWPWQRCPATMALPIGVVAHCDLKRPHERPHYAERGLGMDVEWRETIYADGKPLLLRSTR